MSAMEASRGGRLGSSRQAAGPPRATRAPEPAMVALQAAQQPTPEYVGVADPAPVDQVLADFMVSAALGPIALPALTGAHLKGRAPVPPCPYTHAHAPMNTPWPDALVPLPRCPCPYAHPPGAHATATPPIHPTPMPPRPWRHTWVGVFFILCFIL